MVLECFFGSPRLDREDFACSLRMMLVMECAREEKKGLDFFLNLVDLLNRL